MRRRALLCLVLTASIGHAQTSSTEVGGYVKYLFSMTDVPSVSTSYDQLLHARLNTKWYPTETLSGVLELRGRAYYGNEVENTPAFADNLKTDAGFGNLGSVVWTGRRTVGYVEIDRLFLNWSPERLQVTVGRQRIAWGTNLVWNPIDLFNPLSVLDFDYEERPATDAVRMQYYTGVISKIEIAVKPGSSTSPAVAAGQLTANMWNYDFHLLGGARDKHWFAGAGWAGDILGGGFRGEILASEVPAALRKSPGMRTMISAALSGDYTFPSSFYIHTELLYNTEGVSMDAALARPRAQLLGLLSPARWSWYQEFSYDVSPLVRASIFCLASPVDGSFVSVPSATWSVSTNFDLTVLALVFSGAPLTEFGGQGTAIFVRGKLAF